MGDIRLEADISVKNGNVNRQVNRRRNERNRLRRDEINNQQNARNAAWQAANSLNPNEESLVRRVENNCLRNERNRLRRDEINNQQNARNAARYKRMHCIARSNTIPDYNYLGEMNYICQHCGAKKFPDKTHFLCCHNGKGVLSQPFHNHFHKI